jgi:hypothetical protein
MVCSSEFAHQGVSSDALCKRSLPWFESLLPSLLEPATGACCRPATELLPGTTASLLPSLLPSTDTRFVKFKHVMDRVFAIATETRPAWLSWSANSAHRSSAGAHRAWPAHRAIYVYKVGKVVQSWHQHPIVATLLSPVQIVPTVQAEDSDSTTPLRVAARSQLWILLPPSKAVRADVEDAPNDLVRHLRQSKYFKRRLWRPDLSAQ